MIHIVHDEEEIVSISINDEELEFRDDERWILPKHLLRGLKVCDMPEGAIFGICSRVEESFIYLDSIPMYLQRIGDNEVSVRFEDYGKKTHWNGHAGLLPYMEAKKAVIEERGTELKDIDLLAFEADGDNFFLEYTANISAERCDTIVAMAAQIIEEIEVAAEMRLGAHDWKPDFGADENHFTLQAVLPLLRKLGFINIRYCHGKQECGKDAVFARHTEFGDLEHWGIWVKFGDISGDDASIAETITEYETLIENLYDAFLKPYYDIYTRQQQQISKLVVIVSGEYQDNAIEKIRGKIEFSPVKNNLLFLDGEKLTMLAEKFRP